MEINGVILLESFIADFLPSSFSIFLFGICFVICVVGVIYGMAEYSTPAFISSIIAGIIAIILLVFMISAGPYQTNYKVEINPDEINWSELNNNYRIVSREENSNIFIIAER